MKGPLHKGDRYTLIGKFSITGKKRVFSWHALLKSYNLLESFQIRNVIIQMTEIWRLLLLQSNSEKVEMVEKQIYDVD